MDFSVKCCRITYGMDIKHIIADEGKVDFDEVVLMTGTGCVIIVV